MNKKSLTKTLLDIEGSLNIALKHHIALSEALQADKLQATVENADNLIYTVTKTLTDIRDFCYWLFPARPVSKK